ncbi:glycosyltransferase family 2 protein [Herbaspirillum rubrisubalbicans]|uniref:glycosyltransferase family 2 protein n=1 Tax=Herbaspirillum rubrisubalbicans TaxID=80842 RepID=UPI0012E34C73|nr:glycosyltransferase family A protein [Herbaspirillum rubrisubalbicans]
MLGKIKNRYLYLSNSTMEPFIVIPCLNEEDYIAETCASLGFKDGQEPFGRLVLVDNGSSDGTAKVMLAIQRTSPPGHVLIIQEHRRGYVAARRAGMAGVMAVAQQDQMLEEEVLVLQADADTIYLPGYVQTMVNAHYCARGQLLEGSSVTSREFNLEFPAFTQLCREVDNDMEHWFAPEERQVIVDDKICAFLLTSYRAWGEHRDELDDSGEAVLAETTRLFMRAKSRGKVLREKVENAQALPSRRRLRTQAPGYFACSGFPRQMQWMAGWGRPDEAERFLRSPHSLPTLNRLVRSRQRHQLALFGLLPAVYDDEADVSPGLATLAKMIRGMLGTMSPGRLLGFMLKLADEEDGPLAELLRKR